ncbi:GIY-YIG nuclease family protein [Flavobacterium sp.]|uniref:GIY-YIG nuclease family protein n=1 Tax=Flavobacterium sp. TaxID=239 RepID=UPI00286F3A62|nr:GIY-YIG nuclease family protein [Flavobacterium sp.]
MIQIIDVSGSKSPAAMLDFFVFSTMENVVYILHSQKLGKYYIGFTQNIDLRLDFHQNDVQTRKFTYKADDWELIFTIECKSKRQGLSIEKHIKAMKSRVYIQNLMKYPEMTTKLLEKYSDTSDS